ncbi:hypothetical protein pb186bvf_011748 [Paramecium bursaria]
MSFREYCIQKYQSYMITQQVPVKKKYKIKELKIGNIDKEKMDYFKGYIQNAINTTKTVRMEADQQARQTFGFQNRWRIANNEYFKQEESFRKKEIVQQEQRQTNISFDKWNRNDTVSQQRCRQTHRRFKTQSIPRNQIDDRKYYSYY